MHISPISGNRLGIVGLPLSELQFRMMFLMLFSVSSGSQGYTAVHVVIVGHSIIFWAKKWLAAASGTQLRLGDIVSIHGLPGGTCAGDSYCPSCGRLSQPFHPAPPVIVIHLKGNDLTQRTTLSLRVQACEDFHQLQVWFPGARISGPTSYLGGYGEGHIALSGLMRHTVELMNTWVG